MHGMIIFDSNGFRLRRNFINFASKSAISLKDPKPRYYMKSLLLAIAFMWSFHEIKAHDNLTLCYDRPADFFEEALVIGNGHLGGIVYGGTTTDRISLNDITLWTGEPDMKSVSPEAYRHLPAVRQALNAEDYAKADSLARLLQGKNSEKYQPLGNLFTEYLDNAATDSYRRFLSLNTATAQTEYMRSGKRFSTEYFVSAPDSVIVVHLSTKAKGGINARIRLDSQLPHTIHTAGNRITSNGYAAYAANKYYINGEHGGHFYYDENRGIHFSTIVDIKNNGGTVVAEGNTLRVKGCKDVVITIANATSFNASDKDPVKEGRDYKAAALRIINKASAKAYKQLRDSHIADYQRYFHRVSIDLGKTDAAIKAMTTDRQLRNYVEQHQSNPELEALYFQYGRYLLISSSRTPFVPANLQGLWNEDMDAPWRSNYTININLEENYWGAETTNLSEMHLPLATFIKSMERTGRMTAQSFYGINNGWCAGHNSDIWAMTSPVGEQNESPEWANWTMGGAWLATHLWEHYMFTKDKQFIAEYYPTLKNAAEFCLNWLIEKDRELITMPSTSPENHFITDKGYNGSFFYGGTADLAIIRECVGDAVKAATELGIDEDFCRKANSRLARLRPYKTGRRGQLLEWYHDWDDADWTHRHQSHLIGLYPGHHITPATTPELAKAAARSLEIKGDKTTGWSTGWRINLFARLLDDKNAYHMVRTLLNYVSPDKYEGADRRSGGGTYPNLLDAHSPFQIDGNFSGSAGIAEMLIQSTPESITLLPACPQAWKDGAFSGLCARGGFTVDLKWKDGRAVSATIYARQGGTTTLRANGKEHKLTLKKGEKKQITIL